MLPYTNENFYEIAWAVRDKILDQILAAGVTDRQTALDELLAFEATHSVDLETPWGVVNETGEQIRLITGKVRVSEIEALKGTDKTKLVESLKSEVRTRMKFLFGLLPGRLDAIVELGCGYGINLFVLEEMLHRPGLKYIGAEYTESGRLLCRKLAALSPAVAIDVAFIDHKAPDLSFLEGRERVAFFTCHSIEQVQTLPEPYFDTLAGAAPHVFAAHFEPFGFQVDGFTPANPRQKGFFHDNGWNRNFHATLTGAAARGAITIRRTDLEKFFMQPGNPTSVAVWDNRAAAG
jgi:hypothetical protein